MTDDASTGILRAFWGDGVTAWESSDGENGGESEDNEGEAVEHCLRDNLVEK
jgi:hypothetical protein